MPPEFGGTLSETEYPNTTFLLPTLLSAGYGVTLGYFARRSRCVNIKKIEDK